VLKDTLFSLLLVSVLVLHHSCRSNTTTTSDIATGVACEAAGQEEGECP